MASSIVSLAATAPGATFYLFDGSAADSTVAGVMPKVREAVGERVKLVEFRATEETIGQLHEEMKRRETEGGALAPVEVEPLGPVGFDLDVPDAVAELGRGEALHAVGRLEHVTVGVDDARGYAHRGSSVRGLGDHTKVPRRAARRFLG